MLSLLQGATALEAGQGSRYPKTHPYGPADMDTFVVQFLGQGSGIIKIIHKDMVTLAKASLQQTVVSIMQRSILPNTLLS